MDVGLIESVKQLGLGVVLSLSILGIAWFLLHKVFKMTQNMIDYHFRNQEKAHEYQRQEHKEILEGLKETCITLKSINGRGGRNA